MKIIKNNSFDKFIIEEFVYYSIKAGFSTRNEFFPIYNIDKIDLNQSRNLKKDIKVFLLSLYKKHNKLAEKQHIYQIIYLSNFISKKYTNILFKKRFRIGVSQKIMNLFLKYLWVSGKIKEPFHCPFDNIIKQKLLKGTRNYHLEDWTEFDKIEYYKDYVELAKQKSKSVNLSIANWELINWKRRY